MRFARTGLISAVGFAIILLMGAMIGANAAAYDEPRSDVDGLLKAEMLAEDGTIAEDVESEPPATPVPTGERVADELETLFPETPQLDAAIRQGLVKPLLLAGIWVADVGTGIGYGLASTIGVGATQFVLRGATVGLVAVPCYRLYQLFGEVRDR